MATYVLYAVKVGTTHIPVSDGGHNPQIEAMVEGAASGVDPTFAALRGTAPVVTFTTPALATALGVCGVAGLAVTDANAVVLYYGKLAIGGSYEAGSVHVTVTCNEGMLVLNSISGEHSGPATASYTFHATYDGTNAAFIIAANVALPSLTALAELYSLYAADLDGTQVPVHSGTVSVNPTVLQERAASGAHPTFGAMADMKPTLTFSTLAVKTVLDLCGIDNLSVTTGVLYFGLMTSGSAFAATGVSVSANDCLAAFRGIDARHNEAATVNIEVFPTDDGTTLSLTVNTSDTLPAPTHLGELFTCGPAEFDEVSFETVGWNLDTGLAIIHEGHSGNVEPTMAAFAKREPTIGVEVLDVPQLPAFGQAEAAAEVWLRKMTENGQRVAEATAEHISFTMAVAMSYPEEGRGSWGGRATVMLRLRPVKSGANDVVTIDTAAAIVVA